MMHGPDVFSDSFFKEGQNPNPPELLQPRVGGSHGESVDKDGNVYDDKGNLIREAPNTDPDLIRARDLVRKTKNDPTIGFGDELVRAYAREFRRQRKNIPPGHKETAFHD